MHSRIHGEFGMDDVTEERAKVFFLGLMGVFGNDGFAILRDLRSAETGLTGKPADEIEKVGTKNEEVFASGSMIHHPEYLHFKKVAD